MKTTTKNSSDSKVPYKLKKTHLVMIDPVLLVYTAFFLGFFGGGGGVKRGRGLILCHRAPCTRFLLQFFSVSSALPSLLSTSPTSPSPTITTAAATSSHFPHDSYLPSSAVLFKRKIKSDNPGLHVYINIDLKKTT